MAGVAVALVGFIAFDHLGLLGASGNDWTRFDRQTFPVVRVIAGDELVVRANDQDIAVRLLGADAPDAGLRGNADALSYTQKRTRDRSITLRLEPTQTRDESHVLLAYVFLGDNDNLNLDLIHDGKAYADRRIKHTLSEPFEQAESEARKKARGLWDGLRDEDQPGWRQAWLKAFLAEKRSTTQPVTK